MFKLGFKKVKNNNEKLVPGFLQRIEINFYMLHNCTIFVNNKTTANSISKENKFEQCLTLQLLVLNMF